jgi:hypothetical protein
VVPFVTRQRPPGTVNRRPSDDLQVIAAVTVGEQDRRIQGPWTVVQFRLDTREGFVGAQPGQECAGVGFLTQRPYVRLARPALSADAVGGCSFISRGSD